MENRIITIENSIVSVPATEIWMTQHQLADLFQCFVGKVNANVRAILKAGVISGASASQTYHYQNGNSVEQYNLEMIIALAFRIHSKNAEVFREYIIRKASKPELPEIWKIPVQNPVLN